MGNNGADKAIKVMPAATAIVAVICIIVIGGNNIRHRVYKIAISRFHGYLDGYVF